MDRRTRRLSSLPWVLSLCLMPVALSAAEPQANETEETPRELLLTRDDLDTLHEEIAADLAASDVFETSGAARPLMVLPPFETNGPEPVASQASALHSHLETYIVNHSPVDVMDPAAGAALLRERRLLSGNESDSDGDQEQLATADLRLDGELYSERRGGADSPAIRYVAVVEIVEVASDDLLFRTQAHLTKRASD